MTRRHFTLALLGLGGLLMIRCTMRGYPSLPASAIGPLSDDSAAFRRRWMDPGPLRTVWSNVNGLRIHAMASVDAAPPDAPAIVLVHGSGLSHRYMIPTATRLTSSLKVYMPDLPGYGDSDKPRETYDVPALADAVAAWMPTVGLERASFLGNSFGCQVIADLAARHPQRTQAVVLQGPTTPKDERSVFWQFVRWRQNQRYNPEWLGDVTRVDYEKAGTMRLLRSFFVQIGDPIEDKMPRIQAPVLVIRGSEDPIANQEWCEALVRLCRRGELAVIPEVAHTLCFTAPAQLAELTLKFVRSKVLPASSQRSS